MQLFKSSLIQLGEVTIIAIVHPGNNFEYIPITPEMTSQKTPGNPRDELWWREASGDASERLGGAAKAEWRPIWSATNMPGIRARNGWIEEWTGRFKMCISKLKSNNLLKYYLWRIYWYTLPRTSNMFLFPFLTHWCNMSQPIYISARFPWQIGAISSSEVEALAAVLQELLLAAEEVSCPVPVERCVPGCSLSFRSFVQTRLSYCMKSLPFW